MEVEVACIYIAIKKLPWEVQMEVMVEEEDISFSEVIAIFGHCYT
jgi:hypothetical protein